VLQDDLSFSLRRELDDFAGERSQLSRMRSVGALAVDIKDDVNLSFSGQSENYGSLGY
jgi:hypothetical protein